MTRAATPEPVPTACANCGRAFETPPPNFCPACGQESRVRAPRLMEFVQQFGGAYFSTEGALWRTLKLLLLKPGELTKQYLAGRRKHYVLPLRLYLTVSLLALLLLRLLADSSVGINIPGDLDLRKGEYTIFSFGDGSGAGIKNGQYYCNQLPAWLCKRLERRLNNDPKGLQREAEAVGQRFLSNMGAAMFLMLPLFALWQKIVYWNRRMRYTEHLVFALHVHAFWFIALMFTLADQPWLSGIAFTAVPVYGLMALKRVYGGRWIWLLPRAFIVSMLYGLALSFVLAGVIVWSLVF